MKRAAGLLDPLPHSTVVVQHNLWFQYTSYFGDPSCQISCGYSDVTGCEHGNPFFVLPCKSHDALTKKSFAVTLLKFGLFQLFSMLLQCGRTAPRLLNPASLMHRKSSGEE